MTTTSTPVARSPSALTRSMSTWSMMAMSSGPRRLVRSLVRLSSLRCPGGAFDSRVVGHGIVPRNAHAHAECQLRNATTRRARHRGRRAHAQPSARYTAAAEKLACVREARLGVVAGQHARDLARRAPRPRRASTDVVDLVAVRRASLTTSCASAKAATCARCVTTITWCVRARAPRADAPPQWRSRRRCPRRPRRRRASRPCPPRRERP